MTVQSVFPYLFAVASATLLTAFAVAAGVRFFPKAADRVFMRVAVHGRSGTGLVTKSSKTLALRGATVVAFDCEGCMAHDHRLQYIGRVDGFEMTRYSGLAARVRILKMGNQDIRDKELGEKLVPVDDSRLQKISSGLFFLYR